MRLPLPFIQHINFSKKTIAWALAAIAFLITLPMIFGINDAGYRTVVQWPTGHLFVKLAPGPYIKAFGSTEVYKDVLTFDFDKSSDDSATIDQGGIIVRYQDGGVGTIFGKTRYSLPNDQTMMIKVHKEFRSNYGIATKSLKTVEEEAMNRTAGLMTSEQAYAEKRAIFAQWAKDQLKNGNYATKSKTIIDTDEATGKTVEKKVPEIRCKEDGITPIHEVSDLAAFGIEISGFQITDWDFEPKTLEQIAEKRKANMAIITAKAKAEEAIQDAITAEQQGKANVMTAKYEKEVDKVKAIVDAQKAKEMAIIGAQKKVEQQKLEKERATIAAAQLVAVAEQKKLEAEQFKFAAAEYKQEQILRGEGDSEYKRMVLAADGALSIKVAAYENVMQSAFQNLGQVSWAPSIIMGGGSGSNGVAGTGEGGERFANFIELLTAKAAKDLSLDMTMATGARRVSAIDPTDGYNPEDTLALTKHPIGIGAVQ